MTKRIRLFIGFAVVFGVLGFGVLEAQGTRIYQSSGQAEFPNIVTLKNGNLLLLLNDGYHFNNDSRLFYMIYSHETQRWSSPKLAVQRRNASSFAQLAVDSDGDVHMAYMDGNSSSNREICYAMYSPKEDKWGASYIAYVSEGVNSTWPKIAVEDGKIYIAWGHNYAGAGLDMDICMVENTKGGSWPVERQLRKTISNTGPSVSIHGDFAVRNGKAHAVWMDTQGADDRVRDGNWKMRYNEGTAANNWVFTPSFFLNPNNFDNEYYPALTVDPSGTAHIMYSHKSGPYFHVMKKPDGTWSERKVLLPAGGTNQNMFAFMRYFDGLIHAIWNYADADGEVLVYGRALPDGTWGTPIVVARNLKEPGYPWMTIDQKGDAHVVWSDGASDFRRDIYYSKVQLPGNPPTARLETDKTRGLIPLSVRFDGSKSTDSDGTILKYMWDFGDGTTAEGPIVNHTFNRKGTYKVVLKVLDNDFRVGLAEVFIEASTGEPFAVIKPSATRGVVPMRVEFDGSGSFDEDGQVVSYDWNFGDGNTAVGPLVAHTYTKGGLYKVSLTVTDNDGKTNTETVDINMYQKPTAAFTATPTRGLTPLQVEFDASESTDEDGQIVTYQWSFGDGLYGSGKTVTHTYTAGGPFTAQLTVIDNDGYVDITEMTIDALSKPLAPTQVAVKTDVNRTLLYRDYFNRISWQANTRNAGLFTIVHYRIYRKLLTGTQDLFLPVGEVPASQFHFDDRKHASVQDAARYEYRVTAVDNQGRESDPSVRVSTGGNS